MRRLFVALLLLLCACSQEKQPPPAPASIVHRPAVTTDTAPVPKAADARPIAAPVSAPIARDLAAITADRTLRVLFTFNSTGYFIYRGETMGEEYELLSRFAAESHLRLQPVVVRDSKLLLEMLNRGDGDIVAAQLAQTSSDDTVSMTNGLYDTAPVIVQRGNASESAGATPTVSKALRREKKETAPTTITVRARLISTPAELAGQKVQIPRVSPYRARLLELNASLSDDIDVVEMDESSDRLIQRLAEGEIGYTVAAENLAQLKTGEYGNLIIKPAIGPPQPIAWAVRTNAPALLKTLDDWIAVQRKRGLLAVLYRKYFLDRRGFQTRGASPWLTTETGSLSPFDDDFRRSASIPGWDWRLLAAQAWQESHFNPAAHSWAGAQGLMQIMPSTAKQLHVDARDPHASIEAAARYLWTLDKAWKGSVHSDPERLKFILASYNVGLGHVQDAVRLAEKNHDDPSSWTDVAYWLIRKSKRAVYNDPVVKHGFARGTEPVTYVDQIMARWENYRQFVPETVPETAPLLEPAAVAPHTR